MKHNNNDIIVDNIIYYIVQKLNKNLKKKKTII